jgi:CRP/FNR family cyclic AMP-dependent transcriptional regulator
MDREHHPDVVLRSPPYGFELFDDCAVCKWRNEHFFCNLDPETLKVFEGIVFTNVYPDGAVLFAEGQQSRGVFLMCHGTAKLSISSADGKTLITKITEPGELLGLSSALSGHPYKVTAETIEPSQVNFVRREDLLRFIQDHHSACGNVARQLTRDCEADGDHLRAIGLSHSAGEKLAGLILSWCDEHGKPSDSGIRVQMLMTHEDISQLIGTSRETVTRLLKEFREKNLVSIKGATMTVHNRGALESLVLL